MKNGVFTETTWEMTDRIDVSKLSWQSDAVLLMPKVKFAEQTILLSILIILSIF